MQIKLYPSAVLRKKSRKAAAVGASVQKLLADMVATMHATEGIGLAAPQIGVSKRVAVVDGEEGLLKMVNPRILSKKGLSELEEACLSVPEKEVNVKRAEEILVSYLDENGKRCKKTFRGLTARIIQHEIDHLKGKLIIDYLPWYKRVFKKGD